MKEKIDISKKEKEQKHTNRDTKCKNLNSFLAYMEKSEKFNSYKETENKFKGAIESFALEDDGVTYDRNDIEF